MVVGPKSTDVTHEWNRAMRVILFFINHLLEIVLSKSDVTIQTEAAQFTAYEDVRKRQKFHVNTLRTLPRRSQNGCSMECNRDSTCRSFLICGRNTCVLLNDDFYSTENAQSYLLDDPSCKYLGMNKAEMPKCKDGQALISIGNDVYRGRCNIKSKRVDRQWTEWEHTDERIEDGLNDYKKFKVFTREIKIHEAHGGKTGNDWRVRYEEVELWLKWVREELNWDESIARCATYGGRLYEDLDGTEEQLAWFRKKFNNNRFYWLGIYTKDHKTWMKLSGGLISGSKLLWKKGQPNNKKGRQFYLAGSKEANKVEDMFATLQIFSICRVV